MRSPATPSPGQETADRGGSEPESLLARSGRATDPVEEVLLGPAGSTPGVVPAPPPESEAAPDIAGGSRPFEFRRLSSFGTQDFRKLRLRHEEFVRCLSARLAIHHGLDFPLKLAAAETVPVRKFLDRLPDPTHLTLFRAEPLAGICMLGIPVRLGLCFVERELGGPAAALEDSPALSEIEERLLVRVIETVVQEWCGFWSDSRVLRAVPAGYESNGRYLQTAAPDTLMLALSIETRIRESAEILHLGLPWSVVEPLVARLNAAAEVTRGQAAADSAPSPAFHPALADITLPLSAEVPLPDLTARQVVQLKPGDVLPLPPAATGNVQLRIGRQPKFRGTLGTRDAHWAVQLS